MTARTLDDWLGHCERLNPKSMEFARERVEFTLERVLEVRARLDLRFDCPLISVAGTNGKGSTCAIIESIARHAGYRTALSIKPHLVHFEERCRLNGAMVDAAALLPHFDAVESARGSPPLTYFEFTTLVILRAFAQARPDVIVLEVGLGGRLDAANAFDADCAVIANVALDHTEYLGPDRESIGREKAGIFRTGKPAVVGDPEPPASVIAHAAAIGADLWLQGRDFRFDGDRQQWSWRGRGRRFSGLAYPALRGANQLLNAATALAALESLRDRLPISAQAVRNGLALVELPGRFQIVPGQPALVLDVAHNPQAAGALAVSLDQMGFYPRTFAVFGVMADKDIANVIAPLRPLIDRWFVTDLPIARAAKGADLARAISEGSATPGAQVSSHASPRDALHAALAAADPADRIVVFGSFYTVGGVLKDGLPQTAATHLG
ncbi:MAG TPA: bifunctional tetrahydrofolate synthase/dihydrofolate synthase [Burkholderiaceae bacterium]|nr:bifunctional tetrahydrofolate synthase/dihydrofolate synthase [Burkholderiaceae bacterium]